MVYEFHQFRLDPQHRVLSSTADGRPIALSGRIFDTLLYFVEHRGQLLDKSTLMKAIWPNVVVEENNLNQNISALRRLLGESPGEHRFIVTEAGRGYRFVADVRATTIPEVKERPTESTEPAASGSAAARSNEVEHRSIAVLPFVNVTGDPAKEYFSDGMADELIHTLSKVPGLRVPARTSSFAYKGRNMDVCQIARDLKVAAVLEGSVRSAGERIRVTTQLIDAQNGYNLWSQNYDRQFEDLFRLQDELATAIVQALRATLELGAADIVRHDPPTPDLQAYDLYMRAQAMVAIGNDHHPLHRQLELLKQALNRDPKFARAHNAIAALHAVATVLDVQLPGTLADAERDVERALALDPTPGATHAALGVLHAAQGKWASSEQQFREAFNRDDADPATHLSYGLHVAGSTGFLRRYLATTLDAKRLAPVWIVNHLNIAIAHVFMDTNGPASEAAQNVIELGLQRTTSPLSDVLSMLALRAGRPAEGSACIVESVTKEMRAAGFTEELDLVFAGLHAARQRAAGVDALDRFRVKNPALAASQMMKRRTMVWYSSLGALDAAFEVANESLDHFARHGTIGTAWGFLWMPEMRPFRQDPRFQEFCARLNFFEYWTLLGPPDNHELRNGALVCH